MTPQPQQLPVSTFPTRLLLVVPTEVAYQVFLTDLARRLAERKCDVFLACNTDRVLAGHETTSNAVCHHIPFPRGANPAGHFRAARMLRRLVKMLRPDLIHAHFSAAILTTALAKRRTWPRTLGTYQGLIHTFETGVRRDVFRSLESWSASRMDQTYVLTPDDLAALQGVKHVEQQKSLGFGADHNKFSPSLYRPSLRAALRKRLGIAEDDVSFIFVGRQTRFKGFPETIQGFVRLRGLNCHLIVIGTPDPMHANGLSDSELAAAMANPRIHFIGWTDRVAEYLLAADAMVFPSQREGMSVSIMESLSMAVPVITTSARGCGDLIRDQENGLIIQKSSQDVVRAMQRFADDARLRGQLTSSANFERHLYDRDNFVQEQMAIYARLFQEERLFVGENTPG